MAWVESVKQFSETTTCLTTSGSVSVVAIELFAGFYVIDKLIEEIPYIRAGGILFFSLNPFSIRFFLFLFLPGIFLCLLRFYLGLGFLRIVDSHNSGLDIFAVKVRTLDLAFHCRFNSGKHIVKFGGTTKDR
ncbi:hypothetical protein [uncultured Duncaniella sp.]|uniref:hypothetical protein n=1 Tax=uncultured Duncaniella sp. TaxID=2768039 RepID=UPI00272D94B7|nr:hypothetical protein [uncultured Duncaniella sp.]